MPTIEERLQAIEREHTELKKTIELQTIAIGALVNKATLERLNEKYDKIFDALIAHDRFTNEQLAELRQQQTEEDGKIVGLQTEMRQHFATLEAEMQQRFTENDKHFATLEVEMQQRFTENDKHFAALEAEMRQRFTENDKHFATLEAEMRQRFTAIEAALVQILARLPEKP